MGAPTNNMRISQVSLWRTGIVAASASLFVLGFAMTGCKAVGPDYHRPAPAYDAPPIYKETGSSNVQITASVQPPPAPADGSWKPSSPSDGMLKGKWWEIYNDPKLNELEERIAKYNQSLHAALEKLPDEFREIIVLHDLEGLAYKEIAAVVGIPIGTVMSRLARARGRLRAEIVAAQARESSL